MKFLELRLQDFRNYRSLEVALSPGMNFFLGDNGQGKSNLLEAIRLLSTGSPFRPGDQSTLIRFSQERAFLQGKIERNQLDYEVQLELLKSRKNVILNGKRSTSSQLQSLFPTVLFSPESLQAIKEGADQRRELLDELLISLHPAHAELIADYRKALKSRNRLLKDHLEGLSPLNETLALLESLEPRFFSLARDLTTARLQAIREIQAEFQAAYRDVSRSTVDISVEYVISGESALQMQPEETHDLMRKRAQELRSAELSSGVSLVGPQKHDVIILCNQKDSRFYCSQGQQRALILSFKMAQIVYHRRAHGMYPVLLLDDVLSELDASKRQALISFLHEIRTQVFLTTTDLTLPESFSLDSSAIIEIAKGELVKASGR